MNRYYLGVAPHQIHYRHNPVPVKEEVYILLIQRLKRTHCKDIYESSCVYSHIHV